jgi:SNF2 family DNA or RNA helicase
MLMKHQAEGVEFLDRNNGVGALFMEIGTGKTLTALAAYLYMKEKNPGLKLFVFCPLSLIHGAWGREIERFTNLSWCDMHGDEYKGQDVAIANFEHLLSDKKFIALKGMLSCSGPWMCVIDESSRVKSPTAKTTKILHCLRELFNYRVLLSGTPAPNVEWEYHSQMFFLNPNILGPSFHKFKATHFQLQRDKQVAPGTFMNKAALREMFRQGFKYEISPEGRERLMAAMKPWCHWVKAADCLDLPEEIDEYRIVDMTPAQAKSYKEMKEECIFEIANSGQYAVANYALTKLMKLREVTSNFVISENGDATSLGGSNPKLDALKEIIEECGQRQIIIWAQFRHEVEEIAKNLETIGGGVSMLYGGTPQSKRIEMIERFRNGRDRFMVAHPDSAAHGITWVNCSVEVFYSLDYSYENYVQSRGRIMRYGQRNNCIYFHILCRGTIDEDVLAILQRKATAQEICEKYMKGNRI